MSYIKPTNDDLIKLLEWILEFGRFKIEEVDMNDYTDFRNKLRDAHYTNFHGHLGGGIDIGFNEPWHENKTVFRFSKDTEFKICNFDTLVKFSWNFLKNQELMCRQLSLFDHYT